MNLLIETSGRAGAVGLASGVAIVQAANLDEARRHARDLAATVRRLLEAERLAPSDITSVIVSIGPGSYTGLRVGLASAKAFAFAVGCPLVAVPTFHAIIEDISTDWTNVEIIADALQGHVFTQRFQRTVGQWRAVSELAIKPMKDWATTLREVDAVIGPGVEIHKSLIPIDGIAIEAVAKPSLAGLLKASSNLPQLSREEMFAIEPLYLRGSSAEEKRKAHSEPASTSSAS